RGSDNETQSLLVGEGTAIRRIEHTDQLGDRCVEQSDTDPIVPSPLIGTPGRRHQSEALVAIIRCAQRRHPPRLLARRKRTWRGLDQIRPTAWINTPPGRWLGKKE